MNQHSGQVVLDVAPRQYSYGLPLLLLCIVQISSLVDRQIMAVLMEPIKHALGASDAAMGALGGTAFALFYVVAGFPIARLADNGGRVRVIAGCTAIWSVATALSGVVGSYAQLALARAFVAFGEAGAAPVAQALVVDLFPPQRRGRALSVLSASSSIGLGIGLVGGGWLAATVGWRLAFAIVGLPGLFVAAACYWAIPEPSRRSIGADPVRTTLRDTLRTMWAIPSLRGMLLLAAAVSFTGYGFLIWTPTFLIRTHGLDIATAGMWMGVATVAGLVLGNLTGGLLADWLGPRDARWYMWIPAAGLAAAVPLGIGFTLWPGAPGCILFFALLKFAISVWHAPTYSAALSLVPPEMRATMSATVTMFTTLAGLGLAPLVIGLLSDALTARLGDDALRVALLIVTVSLLLGTAVSLWTAPRLKTEKRY